MKKVFRQLRRNNFIKKTLRNKNVFLVPSLLFILLTILTCGSKEINYSAYVNPFIGTGERGNCYPGAQAPFGMISISPNTSFEDYDSFYARPGYKYDRDEIVGFSCTHYSGVGCHAMQDVTFMPTIGLLSNSPVHDREAYKSKFSHRLEQAEPGFYQVRLLSTEIDFAVSTTTRAGIIDLDYPETKNAHVLFMPTNNANGIIDGEISIAPEKREVSGWLRTGGFCTRDPNKYPYNVYFSAIYNQDFQDYGVWQGEQKFVGEKAAMGDSLAGYISFDCTKNNNITMKIAVSYVSVENARKNLSEVKKQNLEKIKRQTQKQWNKHLSKIKVYDVPAEDKHTFYTALYHNMLQPSIFEDINGEYIGFDDEIHKIEPGRHKYANFSLWDTYRTTVQLQAMLFPKRTSDMVHSLLLDSEQAKGGGLPVWSLANTDNGTMNGYSGSPFIANAYAFGARDFDLQKAKTKMVETALKYHPIKDSRGWEGLEEYIKYGYIPHESYPEKSVSMTVEYSIADYAIAQICSVAGDMENYQKFTRRSKNIFNLYNSESNFLQPRSHMGNWIENFDPRSSMGFDEGNSYHYTWNIPHHIEQLIKKMDRGIPVEARLDEFMSKILTRGWHIEDPYFWLGNEPCFGVPFIYNYLEKPEKTRESVRRIANNFGADYEGLVGDDDVGAMSALYIFSTLGFYPYTPGKGECVVFGPRFSKIEMSVGDQTLKLLTQNNNSINNKIKTYKINHQVRDDFFLNMEDLRVKDPVINFVMENENGTDPVKAKSNNEGVKDE